MIDFLNTFCLKNLINELTCFKSATPSYIELILTNKKSILMRSETFENSLSDFHKVKTTILSKTMTNGILFTDCKSFDENKFNDKLNSKKNKKKNKLPNIRDN